MKPEWDEHKQREVESMEEKANNKKIANENKSFAAVTFDLEAVLVTPHADDAQIYYKSELNEYNLTLFETASNQGYCNLWEKTEEVLMNLDQLF